MTGLTCSRGHRLTRFEPSGCSGGHEHRVFCCTLRVGSRRCGEILVDPPYGGGCEPDDDD